MFSNNDFNSILEQNWIYDLREAFFVSWGDSFGAEYIVSCSNV
jgi:hypothetical protein